MNKNNDISALFDRFQGDARVYREFVEEAQVEQAKGRWPLVATIASTPFEVPPPCDDRVLRAPVEAPRLAGIARGTVHTEVEVLVAPIARKSLLASLARMMTWSGRQARA